MNKLLLAVILILLIFPLWGESLYTPGQILFKTTSPQDIKSNKTGLTDFDTFLSTHQVKSIKPIAGMPGNRYFTADLNQMPDLNALKNGGYSFGGIEYVQPNYLRKLHTNPNDPLYPRQLHHLCSIPSAWTYTTGNHQVIVGVIDSGVLINHPDLAENMYINPNEIPNNGIDDDGNGYIDDWCGWDFADAPEMVSIGIGDYVGQDNDVTDENFHGTHVAGIIGARGNNALGITGVCWNVSIVPIRAGFRTTGGSGYLQDDDAAAALIYAADNGCHVINMSWGDPAYSAIIADACDYAHSKGVILVASSGNDPIPVLSYPSRLSNVISVGSVNAAKVLSGFSSYGHDLDLVAPGEAILSTYKDSGTDMYLEQSGTSMSAPYVTGSIALLLSLMPGLSPAEVRGRLLSATDDINEPGYDIKTGHGLLNTQKLIDNLNPPYVDISEPIDQIGISGTINIMGSVYGDDFARYTLMYRSISDPNMGEWKDTKEHTSQPLYHTQQVHNGSLGQFYVPPSFPEGKYMLRVQFQKNQNNLLKYNFFRTVTVDRTAPILRPEKLGGFSRYDKENLRFYIAAGFNEAVHTKLDIYTSDGSMRTVYGNLLDSLQVWALPSDIPEGDIKIKITAINSSNISFTSQLYDPFMNIAYNSIPTHGFVKRTIGKAKVPLPRMYDFNGNGVAEYMAMDLPTSGYGQVYAYEPSVGGHIQTNWFGDAFWPLDIGNTNARGMEALLLKADTAQLWETKLNGNYPSKDSLLWTDPSITGGIMADYDGNGTTDILLVKNLPAERIIQIYSRSSSGMMTARNALKNTTPTNLRNNFVPTVIVANLDQDNRPDIITADTDGDVMIFEVLNNAESPMVWNTRIPIGNAYQLASGDFDGDGKKDFIVGGYNTNILNQNLNYWYFEGFTSNANNSYTSMGSIMFNTFLSQNAIMAADMDNDGKDEIILGIAPNLYILKYLNGKFQPIFRSESSMNFRLASWKDSANKTYVMANYPISADSLVAVDWSVDVPFTGPATPANFSAKPLGANSVHLTWQPLETADYYKIYRLNEANELSVFDHIIGSSYTDLGLQTNSVYSYAITAVDTGSSPSESMPSSYVSALPLPIPEILEVKMQSLSEVRLMFNQSMPASTLNPNLFTLSEGIGKPISVNSIANQHGLQLRFRNALPEISSLFVLYMNGIVGSSGVAMVQDSVFFAYTQDMEAPHILDVQILSGNKAVQITLSEEIISSSAQHLGNYFLSCPANDPDNSVQSVQAEGHILKVTFADKLRYSDQGYYIRIENITDLAGNRISPQHNLARFALRDFKNLEHLKVYPNPARRAEHSEVIFLNFPPHKKGKIAIYDASGALVYTANIGPFNPDNNRITWRWNLQNNDGRRISSGVYFYVVEMDNERARGKLAVVN